MTDKIFADRRRGTKSRPARSSPWIGGDAIWLSVASAAVRAGVSARSVKRWIASGRLPATRLPSPKGKGHLRIRLGDLEALLARGTLQ